MKLFHLSDLHIGKQLHGYSLAKNQREILTQIVEKTKQYRPDAVLIAGDIYDKSIPSGEAYSIFDDFLQQLALIQPAIPVLIIAGNHDSPERLQFASSFLEKHRIYIETMPPGNEDEKLRKVTLEDDYGKVNFYLLPFTKPGYIRALFPEEEIDSYEKAIKLLLEREEINIEDRNVLLSHQFYKAGLELPDLCDSENKSSGLQIGGLDVIDISVLEKFDYVALGHLHGAQKVGRETVRYCGTPLKYSISEEHHKKAITMITMPEKGKTLQIEQIPLQSMQDVRTQKGLLAEIVRSATEENRNDYLSATITDEIEPFLPKEQLMQVYPYLLELRVDNLRTRKLLEEEEIVKQEFLTPMESFREFYNRIHHADLTEQEEKVMQDVMDEVLGGREE